MSQETVAMLRQQIFDLRQRQNRIEGFVADAYEAWQNYSNDEFEEEFAAALQKWGLIDNDSEEPLHLLREILNGGRA